MGGGGRSLRHKKITIEGVKTLERNQASFEAPPPGGGRCSGRGGGSTHPHSHTGSVSPRGDLKNGVQKQRHFCVWFTALGQPKGNLWKMKKNGGSIINPALEFFFSAET